MRTSPRELWQSVLQYGDPAPLYEPLVARRKNRHLEQGVLNAVLTVLRTHPRVAWAVRMNSGAYKMPDGRFVRFGFPGCPDILGQMRDDGRILMIECKAARGRLTDEQTAVLETVGANNGVCGVARSIEDALAIVEGR